MSLEVVKIEFVNMYYKRNNFKGSLFYAKMAFKNGPKGNWHIYYKQCSLDFLVTLMVRLVSTTTTTLFVPLLQAKGVFT